MIPFSISEPELENHASEIGRTQQYPTQCKRNEINVAFYVTKNLSNDTVSYTSTTLQHQDV